MYIPDLYKNEDRAAIADFIQNNGFAILVSQVGGRLWATHIPLQLDKNQDGKQVLYGHISKENPQWADFKEQEILAVFSGPHAYVSSSWYDHENVPTWNYTAVHVYGKVKILEGKAVMLILKKLVDKYETDSKNPVRVENLSRQTMMQSRGIVAFEIEITEIQAKRKMSQNRDDKNYNTVILELEKTGKPDALAVAKEMKKTPR